MTWDLIPLLAMTVGLLAAVAREGHKLTHHAIWHAPSTAMPLPPRASAARPKPAP